MTDAEIASDVIWSHAQAIVNDDPDEIILTRWELRRAGWSVFCTDPERLRLPPDADGYCEGFVACVRFSRLVGCWEAGEAGEVLWFIAKLAETGWNVRRLGDDA